MRGPSTLEEWISGRRPPVPGGFAAWMRPERPEAPCGPGALAGEARDALARTLAMDPDERDAAFHLLAADGFATWACEAALEGDDPEGALDGILAALLE